MSRGGIWIAAARDRVDRDAARRSLAAGPGGQAKHGLIAPGSSPAPGSGPRPGSGFDRQLTNGVQFIGGLVKLGRLLPQPGVDRGGCGVQQPATLPLMLHRPDPNFQRRGLEMFKAITPGSGSGSDPGLI